MYGSLVAGLTLLLTFLLCFTQHITVVSWRRDDTAAGLNIRLQSAYLRCKAQFVSFGPSQFVSFRPSMYTVILWRSSLRSSLIGWYSLTVSVFKSYTNTGFMIKPVVQHCLLQHKPSPTGRQHHTVKHITKVWLQMSQCRITIVLQLLKNGLAFLRIFGLGDSRRVCSLW